MCQCIGLVLLIKKKTKRTKQSLAFKRCFYSKQNLQYLPGTGLVEARGPCSRMTYKQTADIGVRSPGPLASGTQTAYPRAVDTYESVNKRSHFKTNLRRVKIRFVTLWCDISRSVRLITSTI